MRPSALTDDVIHTVWIVQIAEDVGAGRLARLDQSACASRYVYVLWILESGLPLPLYAT